MAILYLLIAFSTEIFTGYWSFIHFFQFCTFNSSFVPRPSIRVVNLLFEFHIFYTSFNPFICVSSLFIQVPYLLYEFQFFYLHFIPFYSSSISFIRVSIMLFAFHPFLFEFHIFCTSFNLLFAFHPFLFKFHIFYTSFNSFICVLSLFIRVSYLS